MMAAALALGSAVLTGCQTAGGPTTVPAVPIAFESIEGPPEALRNQLAGLLAGEAAARQMRLVATGGEARYRVRGYLAPSAEDGGSLAYVWDVFDATHQRAQRVTGASPARGNRSDWSGIDENALRAVARRTLDGIAVFLVASETAGPADAGVAAAAAPPADSE